MGIESNKDAGTRRLDALDPHEAEDEAPYTVFTRPAIRAMVALVGFAMLFSPLSANIYFPAMNQLQSDLGVSTQLINLTITAYLILQAIAPALFGDAADIIGRRPAFLAMFAVYTLANLGLGLQNSYPPLLVLRMVQSLGCSAAVAVSYGVVADVAMAADRGGLLGTAMIATNLGPAIAPVIGGCILSRAGWHWIFWFLMIAGVVMLSLLALLLPETARSIVGNGSIDPSPWRRALLSKCRSQSAVNQASGMQNNPLESAMQPQRRRTPNPLRSLRLVFYKDSFMVLLMSGTFYTIYYCLQASIATLFKELYGYNDAIIGTCYLSIGFGVVTGGYLNGRLLDRNYTIVATDAGLEAGKRRVADLTNFPIEKARLLTMAYIQIAHMGILIGYGWVVQHSLHVSVPLVFHFFLGFLETCIVQTFNTLLVDIFQESPSAAAASGNIFRCGLSAAGVAAMEPLMWRMGYGWYFTFLGLAGGILGLVGREVIVRMGMKWRQDRAGKQS
ncbi:major facilitator superfamily domain-containing protein [Dactylonectria estremocensis]|uniref:Major facilitator superfamily domain-containing protein n=1 Tax=Dactylonectria estremocensis TaxID=1079267 RepID=A0A9P9JHB6_9HYPO|nr:major facilitator superfamily domain-containing protein [Dactylonectria estremocensis]